MRIGFWKTKKDKLMVSHQKGLNEEQVQALHLLKVGDRLCLWQQGADGNGPNFTIKKLEEKPQ